MPIHIFLIAKLLGKKILSSLDDKLTFSFFYFGFQMKGIFRFFGQVFIYQK